MLAYLLEKIQGVILVDKLYAILLLEAYFNGDNKCFFGKYMIDQIEKDNKLPNELFARRETEAIEVALNQTLLSNIAHQKKRSLAIANTNVVYYYDCFVYYFASLACQKIRTLLLRSSQLFNI